MKILFVIPLLIALGSGQHGNSGISNNSGTSSIPGEAGGLDIPSYPRNPGIPSSKPWMQDSKSGQKLYPRSGRPPSPRAGRSTQQQPAQGGSSAAHRSPNSTPPTSNPSTVASGPSTGSSSTSPREARLRTTIKGPASIKIWKGQEINNADAKPEKIKVGRGKPFEKTWTDPDQINARIKTKGLSAKHETHLKGKEAKSNIKTARFLGGDGYHFRYNDDGSRHGGNSWSGGNSLTGVGQRVTHLTGKAKGRVTHDMAVSAEGFFPP